MSGRATTCVSPALNGARRERRCCWWMPRRFDRGRSETMGLWPGTGHVATVSGGKGVNNMTTLAHHDPFNLDDLIAVPLARAAQIAEITKRRLWYWDRTSLVRPTIRRAVSRRETVRLYTFEDLVALLVVAKLRRRFSLQHIREVVAHLKIQGYEAPLSELTFAVLGDEIYFQHPDGSWEGDRVRDQLVLREVLDLDEIRTLIRKGVQRPASARGETKRTRGRLGGKLLFAGTRIPVEMVQRRLGRGATERDILAAYPDLTPEDIAAAREGMRDA